MKSIESIAAVFCHEDRIFAIRRQSHLNIFPGYDSFPGGKIDEDDSTQQHPSKFLCDLEGQKMHALTREVKEELSFDLPQAITSGQVTSVRYLATALPPPVAPIRFKLHYYRVDVATQPEFKLDYGEIAESSWETPQQLVDRFRAGNALMVPPMVWLLEALSLDLKAPNFDRLSARTFQNDSVYAVEPISELKIISAPSNTLPPATRTNALLFGDKGTTRVLVDPSPRSSDIFEKLLLVLTDEPPTAIFISHHHPDHHEFAPQLARHLKAPIWLSQDTLVRIKEKYGSDYFSGIKIEIKKSRDLLTYWKGEPVYVHEIPGHDRGQLAFAPESLRWFFVGDLIQDGGTVCIAAPAGDMAEYFQTLEKIIKLDPVVIIPSHGMPSRSTAKIKKTLQHRRGREETVKQLVLEGKSEAEMLDIVYQNIDKRLRPLALENIRSHIAKLKAGNQLT